MKPSLGEKRPKTGLNIKTESMFDYRPSFEDCCTVLGTEQYIEDNDQGWVASANTSDNNQAVFRSM
jgi:hypothetical protein